MNIMPKVYCTLLIVPFCKITDIFFGVYMSKTLDYNDFEVSFITLI